MNNRNLVIAQAVRGPILLITLGILFALHQSGVISFGRTWPLLIIILGIMKLIERMIAPPVAYRQAPPPYPPVAGGPVR